MKHVFVVIIEKLVLRLYMKPIFRVYSDQVVRDAVLERCGLHHGILHMVVDSATVASSFFLFVHRFNGVERCYPSGLCGRTYINTYVRSFVCYKMCNYVLQTNDLT